MSVSPDLFTALHLTGWSFLHATVHTQTQLDNPNTCPDEICYNIMATLLFASNNNVLA